MKLTLLCNAGLAIETKDAMLLVDVPNQETPPFYGLPDNVWQSILLREVPYNKVCGFWFTHDHSDHFDQERMKAYLNRWPKVSVFLPGDTTQGGRVRMGPFTLEYHRMKHAPIPNAPAHVVTWIETGEGSVYLAADAELDPERHREVLKNRTADAAVWNSMYLSRPETRSLMKDAGKQNYIYHMPAERPDCAGL